MSERERKNNASLVAILTAAVMTTAAIAVAFFMVNGYGLVDGLDFGCGQYYYTDIPDWAWRFSRSCFTGERHLALIIILFATWAYAMYRFWIFVDKHSRKETNNE